MVIHDAFTRMVSWGQEFLGWSEGSGIGDGVVNGNQGLGMGRMDRCLG